MDASHIKPIDLPDEIRLAALKVRVRCVNERDPSDEWCMDYCKCAGLCFAADPENLVIAAAREAKTARERLDKMLQEVESEISERSLPELSVPPDADAAVVPL